MERNQKEIEELDLSKCVNFSEYTTKFLRKNAFDKIENDPNRTFLMIRITPA